MNDQNLGATGNFPKGKLNKDDEGELRMAVGADPKNHVVMINFGKPVAWLGLPKKEAKELGELLQRKAEEL